MRVSLSLAVAISCTYFTSLASEQTSSVKEDKPFATIGDIAITPIGWIDFCVRYKKDCEIQPPSIKQIKLDEQKWRLMLKINHHVNKDVEPVTDMDHHGLTEHWDYPTDGKGDCEDYVLEKKKRLIKAGFSPQALLVTVVIDKKNQGHAVLTIVTDRGEFILDNQENKVLIWSKTGYIFVKRQSYANPNIWLRIK